MAAQRKRSSPKAKAGVTVSRGWLWVIGAVCLLLLYRCGVSAGASSCAALGWGVAGG